MWPIQEMHFQFKYIHYKFLFVLSFNWLIVANYFKYYFKYFEKGVIS